MIKVNLANAFNDVFQPAMGINDTAVMEYVNIQRNTQELGFARFDPVHAFEQFLCEPEPAEQLECSIDSAQSLCVLDPSLQGPQKRKFTDDTSKLYANPPRGMPVLCPNGKLFSLTTL